MPRRHADQGSRPRPDARRPAQAQRMDAGLLRQCLHHAPVAFVPLMIRWGANASSDKLTRGARYSAFGHKGATLQHPGWIDAQVGFAPFPADQLS
jgi:hypothetical protein